MNKTKQTKTLNKKKCNHCGGALRFYHDSITCFMCSRDINHICGECMIAQKVTTKEDRI